jgi:hypothetical protein
MILLGTTPLWLAAPAFAQATPDGATALRDGLTEMLKPILSAQVQGKPVFDGPITVDPAGAVYRVRFPGVDTTLSVDRQGTPKTLHLRCGGADYTATPQSGDTYRLEGDNPLRCTGDVSGETQPLTVNSSSVKTTMVVDPARKLMTDGSWDASTITVQFGDPARTVTVDSLTGTSKLVPAAASGRGDVTIHMDMQGLRSGDPSAVGSFSLAKASYDVHAPDFDMSGVMAAYGQSFGQLLAMVDHKPTDPLPAETRTAVLDMYRKIFAAYGDSVDGSVSASDLKVTAPEAKIAIGSLSYGLKMAGMSADTGTGDLDIALSGLAIDPPSPYAQFIPTDSQIKLSGSKIPYGPVGQAYLSFIDTALSAQPGSKKPGADAEMQQKMMQAYARIGAELQKAGSQLDIKTFHITAPEAAIDLGGAVKADAKAKHGVTTALKLRLTNLDGLIKFAQGQPDGSQAAAGLTMVQTMGRQATDNGRPARDYDIVVDETGKVLINGTDFAAFAPK